MEKLRAKKGRKTARKANLALKQNTKLGSRIRTRKADDLIKGMQTKRGMKSLKTKDVLEKLTQFDFESRCKMEGASAEAATELWKLARAGKFAPWIPCVSRNQPAVCKLQPELVVATRGQKLEQIISHKSQTTAEQQTHAWTWS